MAHVVDFQNVSTAGLESSPVAPALAGLRAHEARYFWTKYRHRFEVEPAGASRATLDHVHRVLSEERGLVISARPLQTSSFQVADLRFAYVFYESGLSVNVMYALDDPKRRAVGFKLAEGMEVPAELEGRFRFARMKSKLAGVIQGSYFVIKKTYG